MVEDEPALLNACTRGLRFHNRESLAGNLIVGTEYLAIARPVPIKPLKTAQTLNILKKQHSIDDY